MAKQSHRFQNVLKAKAQQKAVMKKSDVSTTQEHILEAQMTNQIPAGSASKTASSAEAESGSNPINIFQHNQSSSFGAGSYPSDDLRW